MASLEGKVVVVTGAGRRGGIGEAVAQRLARDGAHLVLGDICAPPTELAHAGSGAVGRAGGHRWRNPRIGCGILACAR